MGSEYQAIISGPADAAGPILYLKDGRTIVIGTPPITVELQGLSATSLTTDRGYSAQSYILKLTANKWVHCYFTEKQLIDVPVGVCLLDDGTDLAATLIFLALANPDSESSAHWYSHLVQQPAFLNPDYWLR